MVATEENSLMIMRRIHHSCKGTQTGVLLLEVLNNVNPVCLELLADFAHGLPARIQQFWCRCPHVSDKILLPPKIGDQWREMLVEFLVGQVTVQIL